MITIMRLLVLTTLWLVLPVFANTEIVNIQISEHPTTQAVGEITRSWPIVDPLSSERRWDILPARLHTPPDHVCADKPWHDCPHDLWLAFDFEHPQWTRFSKFTFRISWPASVRPLSHTTSPPLPFRAKITRQTSSHRQIFTSACTLHYNSSICSNPRRMPPLIPPRIPHGICMQEFASSIPVSPHLRTSLRPPKP
jgi:hypothetical protein